MRQMFLYVTQPQPVDASPPNSFPSGDLGMGSSAIGDDSSVCCWFCAATVREIQCWHRYMRTRSELQHASIAAPAVSHNLESPQPLRSPGPSELYHIPRNIPSPDYVASRMHFFSLFFQKNILTPVKYVVFSTHDSHIRSQAPAR